MATKNFNKTVHESTTSKPVERYNTSKEDIVKELDITFDKIQSNPLYNDKIVIAKDNYGLYATIKRNIGNLLDAYKVYNRFEVKEIKNGEEVEYKLPLI